jgi:agmatinase
MLSSNNLLVLVAAAAVVVAHGDHSHDQTPIEGPHKQLWYNTLPGDGGTQVGAQHHDL